MVECSLCRVCPASVYCESDKAYLCWDCDGKVHSANFLVARHSRLLLCRVCGLLTPWKATGPQLFPCVTVCNHCRGLPEPEVAIKPDSAVPDPDPFDDDDEDDDDDDLGESSDDEDDDDDSLVGDEDDDDLGVSADELDDDDSDEDREAVKDEDADNQIVPIAGKHARSTATPPPAPASSSSDDDKDDKDDSSSSPRPRRRRRISGSHHSVIRTASENVDRAVSSSPQNGLPCSDSIPPSTGLPAAFGYGVPLFPFNYNQNAAVAHTTLTLRQLNTRPTVAQMAPFLRLLNTRPNVVPNMVPTLSRLNTRPNVVPQTTPTLTQLNSRVNIPHTTPAMTHLMNTRSNTPLTLGQLNTRPNIPYTDLNLGFP